MSETVAVGTKVFTRDEQLRRLLDSVPPIVDTVYVADDGEPTELKERIYSADYAFSLEVIDMKYDAGLGAGRAAIVERLSEDFLAIVDTDHRIPPSFKVLLDVIRTDERLGGVAGAIVEPDRDRYYIEAQDFAESDARLIRSPTLEDKNVEIVARHPIIRFDFIPNAALFRRECVEDYCWDPAYVIEQEHADFYVGHWRQTDWTFAVCPSVIFEHYPGGDETYLRERGSLQKERNSQRYFLGKWGYERDDTRSFVWAEGGKVPNPSPSALEWVGRRYTEHGMSKTIRLSLEHLLRLGGGSAKRLLRRLLTQK
jgi:glycosyltransferase involved in cell wall biosynthesis